MSHIEESLVRRWSGARILLGSVALAVLGVAPLMLYVWLGPADGNPIGLGLLAVASVPIAGIGAAVGLIKLAVEYFSRGRA